MKMLMQEYLHDPEKGIYGDCFRAALATILQVPVNTVPHFLIDGNEAAYHTRVAAYLAPKGLMLLGQSVFDVKEYQANIAYEGKNWYHLASGPSPVFAGSAHRVVADAGILIHDPHPRNKMVPSVDYFEMLVVTDIRLFTEWVRTKPMLEEY